ncbi:MAG TPA: DUF1778 domain-containing protein [Actinomycetota bacterium]|nr:DUF1778 domain-containing protein [Tetrasphaera sp.]HPJ18761.1 DUF1778 domain-containing protein [Actinomycetota bacterium]HPQ85750.1 DUF1778 domain-containing protein [Actinomycetota bacterium]
MTTKTERLNLRCSAASIALLREATQLQGQDLTSFMMSASLDRARAVLTEDMALRMTPADVRQLEKALDAELLPNPQLAALVRSVKSGCAAHAGEV